MAYRLSGQKVGIVRFDPDKGTISKETETMSSKMTAYALETGASVSDHVFKNPEQIQISGILVGGMDEMERLKDMWRSRDLVSYEGRIRASNMVIVNLQDTTESSNMYGCSFTATLQKATMVTSAYVEIQGNMLMSQMDGNKSGQTAATKNAGRQTTASQSVAASAYEKYVASYDGKSSSGPSQRKTASYNGVSVK